MPCYLLCLTQNSNKMIFFFFGSHVETDNLEDTIPPSVFTNSARASVVRGPSYLYRHITFNQNSLKISALDMRKMIDRCQNFRTMLIS